MEILKQTIEDLKKIDDLSSYSIEEISLVSDFSVVKLNDGSVGSSLNYANALCLEKEYDPADYEKSLKAKIAGDPLLLNYLNQAKSPQDISLLTSVISALSQKFLTAEFLRKKDVLPREVNGFAEIAEILSEQIDRNIDVAIIGFEGLSSFFLQNQFITNLYLIDYNFSPRRGKFYELAKLSLAKMLRRKSNQAKVQINDGAEIKSIINSVDWLIISGSALCNDSLENILSAAKAKKIILQGPSCSILPFELFKRGVTDIFTTKKNLIELEYSRLGQGKINEVVDRDYIHMAKIKI